MKYMYITNKIDIAQKLDDIGLDMIWIDLEKNGKEERQKNMNTVKSNHSLDDINKISKILKKSDLLVRVNPIFEGSEEEINTAIKNGADIIMLPYFKTKKEVENFFQIVNKRCRTILLLETKEAVENLDSILEIKEIENIHIGLNDLSLSYKNKFMFEPLANGIVEEIIKKIQKFDIEYGFGGIARIGEGTLPASLILSEHIRLDSKQVILSRSFCKEEHSLNFEDFNNNFLMELKKIKTYENKLKKATSNELLSNHKKLIEIVEKLIKN